MKKKSLAALLCAAILLSSPLGDNMPLVIGAAAYEEEPSAEEVTYLDLEYAASTLAAPTASRKSGTITCSEDFTTVELSAEKGTVYYSLNGAKYQKYTSAIKLTKNSTIKAYAKSGSSKSETVTFTYKLKPKVTGSVTEYENGIKEIKLDTKVSGVEFYYTIDGSKPTPTSAYRYGFGITLLESCRVRVLAVKPGWKNATLSQDFTVNMKKDAPDIPSESSLDQFRWYGVKIADGSSDRLAYKGGDVIKVVFPSVFDGKPVKSVLVDPDYGSRSFTSVVIPNSVTEIEDGAFAYCALTSVTIPDSVTKIGVKAFIGCEQLKSVTIPDSVTEIGYWAFSGNPLKSVTIPNSVTIIGNGAFERCTSLKSVTLSDHLKYLPEYLFAGCTSLKSVTIPDSAAAIRPGAFQNCTSLKSITIPNGVKDIRFSAFEGCTSLKNVTISDSVTWIDENAFTGCTSLKSITIPDSVTRIGCGRYINPLLGVDSDLGAFAGCKCTVTYKGKKYTSADNYEALYKAINGN